MTVSSKDAANIDEIYRSAGPSDEATSAAGPTSTDRYVRPSDSLSLRPKQWATVCAVLVLLTAVYFLFDWANRAKPLEEGSQGRIPQLQTGEFAVTKGLASGARDYELTYRANAVFTYAFSIQNRSRLDVKISGIAPDVAKAIFAVDHIGLNASDRNPSEEAQPFHPFTLKPRAQRTIFVTAHFMPCAPMVAGGATVITAEPIEVSILGARHNQSVPLRTPISLLGPGQTC